MENQFSKNGVMVNGTKTWPEMTTEEREALVIISGRSVEDYATFQIRRNKTGELLGVTGYELTEAKTDELRKRSETPNIMDALGFAYGDQKQSKQARNKYEQYYGRKFDYTKKQVRRVLEGK